MAFLLERCGGMPDHPADALAYSHLKQICFYSPAALMIQLTLVAFDSSIRIRQDQLAIKAVVYI